jgi:hypothetical protein
LIYSVFLTSSKHNIKGYEEYPFAAYLREMKEKGWPTSADEKSWNNDSSSDGFVDYTNISKKTYAEWEKMREEKNAANAAKNKRGSKGKEDPKEDDDSEEEKEVVVTRKAGRPKRSYELKDSDEEEEEVAMEEVEVSEASPKKTRGRPPKADSSPRVPRTGKSTKKAEIDESDEDSDRHEYSKVNNTNKKMVPVKMEKEDKKFSNERARVGSKMETKEEKRARIKARFLEKPPQSSNHPETFTMYVLEAPDCDHVVVVAGLLNNNNKQPSVFLRASFLQEGLSALADLDKESPAVERFRDALASCEKITLRRIEHGDNESQFHEFKQITFFHELVLFVVQNDTVKNFEQGLKQILRSDMFFEAVAEVTTLMGQAGVSIQAMQDEKSAVWRYLKNLSNMTTVRMQHLDQVLLDDDIVWVLKEMYKEEWNDYQYVGWKNKKSSTKKRGF